MKITRPYWLAMSLTFYAVLCIGQSKQDAKDIESAYPVCELKTYIFPDFDGAGKQELKRFNLDCFSSQFKETNAKWMQFQIESPGKLAFEIEPVNPQDDIDFVVFRDIGEDDVNLIPIRCMGSGVESTNGITRAIETECLGNTGMAFSGEETKEMFGCSHLDNNYLKSITCRSGDKYYLFVNNYSSKDGFKIRYYGTTQLNKSQHCNEIKSLANTVVVYPNPASKFVNVDFELDATKVIKFELINFAGAVVKQINSKGEFGENSFNLDIKSLTPGAYIIAIDDGDTRSYHNFIVI